MVSNNLKPLYRKYNHYLLSYPYSSYLFIEIKTQSSKPVPPISPTFHIKPALAGTGVGVSASVLLQCAR